MTALNKAFASANETPLDTIEIVHSALTGGVLRFVRGYKDITATIESGSDVVFSAMAFGAQLPERSANGSQDLTVQMDNVSTSVYQEIKAVVDANRTTRETGSIIFRFYLPSDLTQPAGQTYSLQIDSSVVESGTAIITASYAPLPNISWPRKRYSPTIYPWLRYAR